MFSSVTCLNGHVHQLFSKTEGNVTFYSSTPPPTRYPILATGRHPNRLLCPPGNSTTRWVSARSATRRANRRWR